MSTKRTKETHVPKPEPPMEEPEQVEPLVQEQAVAEADPVIPVIEYSVDEEGRYVAPKQIKDLFIMIGGARYEHVAETPDGRWVYARS
jgi:hypothetical protein